MENKKKNYTTKVIPHAEMELNQQVKTLHTWSTRALEAQTKSERTSDEFKAACKAELKKREDEAKAKIEAKKKAKTEGQ